MLRPGQYRYIRENAWWTAMFGGKNGQDFAYLADNVIETWVPQDQNGNSLLRRSIVGERQWIAGSAQAAKAAGVPEGTTLWPTGVITAPCGDFYPNINAKPSCADVAGRAGWQEPTPAWLATLPTDPQAMMARLRD